MRQIRSVLVPILLVLSTVGLCGSRASGQTLDWTNAAGGTYGTPGNWTPAGPPGPAALARFGLPNTYNVTFAANASTSTLSLNQGNVTFFLNGFTYQLTNTLNNGLGAAGATASLRIANGTFLPGNLAVGGNAGSDAVLTLDAGSVTTVGAGVFYVGTSGTGHLNVQTGATLATSGSTGLGLNAAGVGSATVAGAGSAWTVANTLRVGSSGDGALSVLNGGTVTANALEVGENFNGVGKLILSGANATLTTPGTANIGGSSALFPAASATVAVGPGATLNLNGTTNLRTTATVNLTGGTLNLATLNVAPGAAVNWSAGTVRFAGGASVNAAVLDLLLAGTHTLGTGRTLVATAGTVGLDVPLAVAGGTLEVAGLEIDAPLNVGAFGTVSATDLITIGAGQTVQVENLGKFGSATATFNDGGTLELKGSQAVVTGFVANNFGTVQGTGRFAAGLNNGTGGTIRAGAGDRLVIATPGLTNPGTIDLAGGEVEYTHTLSNLANGSIVGRGVFRGGSANPGGNGLSNIGLIALSGGTTDFHGDVLNSAGGKIVASGAGVVTFFDDVTHNGAEIRTNGGSRTVFFGGLTGAGPFTGTGTVEINGDLKPGNSPALVTFGGDLELGPGAEMVIEVGGTTPGAGHDRVSAAGRLALDGTLTVALVGGFAPAPGDAFDVLDWGDLEGTFAQVSLPPLPGGLGWDASQLHVTGTLKVVPEPASLLPAALVLMALGVRPRRRRHDASSSPA